MSDNVTTAKQRSCTALACEHKKYIMDMFSGMEPGHNGHNEARKQLFLYITTAEENGRKTFLQEEQIRLGLFKVHSDKFCWKKEAEAGTLIAQLEMGDFQAVKRVERKKIDEMTLPEKLTYTLPSSDASCMKLFAKLLSGSFQTLLETEQLKVNLSLFPQGETKPGIEHDYRTNQPVESSVDTDEQMLT